MPSQRHPEDDVPAGAEQGQHSAQEPAQEPAPSVPITNAQRHLDLVSLKALAHPLRVQMYERLATHGPSTASALAEQLGESSGSTSYHLRQLARHGFVQECQGRGTGRERWWEVVPGGFEVRAADMAEPAVRDANRAMMSESFRLREQNVRDFMNAIDSYEEPWVGAGVISLTNVHMTHEKLRDFIARYQALLAEVAADLSVSASPEPGSRPVQIQFNAFPVFGGEIEPEGEKL